MGLFHNRYNLDQPWQRTNGGWLASAKDNKLNRSVLLWRISDDEQHHKEELLRRLGNASRFPDRRFVPLLDVAFAEDELYAVLSMDMGYRLSERLSTLQWPGSRILENVRELCSPLREARRERLQDFSVTAENIWVDNENRLLFINSWSVVNADRRDVRGLSMLLYQLCSRSEEFPISMSAFNQAIASVMTSLPGASAHEAAEWAGSAFLPSCTLKNYENGMKGLLEVRVQDSAPMLAVPSRMQAHVNRTDASVRLNEKRPDASRSFNHPQELKTKPADAAPGAFRLWPWITFSLIVFCIGLAGIAGLWYMIRQPADETVSPAGATASHQASSSSPIGALSGSAKPSGGGSAPTPSASPVVSTKPTEGAPVEITSNTVPDLTKHTVEDASQLVLKAGLKYQYFLEPNDMDRGLVFKQDLVPGTPVAKGDRIIFWVSKGK